jgi:hypothetical protein
MNTITVTPLSLEAGAAHLEKLLRENTSLFAWHPSR